MLFRLGFPQPLGYNTTACKICQHFFALFSKDFLVLIIQVGFSGLELSLEAFLVCLAASIFMALFCISWLYAYKSEAYAFLNIFTMLGALPAMPSINSLKKAMDYKEYGGALFLGVKKPVVKAHGSSDERLFEFTIKQAEQFVKNKAVEKMIEEFEK